MTRTLRGSLLIASMLVVTWATSSEACHRRRALRARPSRYGGRLRGPHGLLRRRGRLRHGWRGLLRRRVCRRNGRLSRRRPARRVRLRPARLQPGRPRRAGVRAGGAARPGRRRLRPGALTVHRSSDHPAGAPAWTYGFTRRRCRRRSADGRRGRLPRRRRPVRILARRFVAAGRHAGDDPALRAGRTDGSGW